MAGKHERGNLVEMTVATRDEGVAVYAGTLDITIIGWARDGFNCLAGLGVIEGEHVVLYPRESAGWSADSQAPPNCIVLPLCNVMLVAI